MPDYKELDKAILHLASYDLVTFASENGIRAFCQRIATMNIDRQTMRDKKFITYKPDVAILQEYGLDVWNTPEEQSPQSIVKGLKERGINHGDLLAVVPEVVGVEEPYGVNLYIKNLRDLGLSVDKVPGYQVVAAKQESVSLEMHRLLKGEIDAVIFTYSGEILAMKKLLGADWLKLNKTALAYKGPFTAENGKKAGFDVDVVPQSYTLPGLLEALERFFSGTGKQAEH